MHNFSALLPTLKLWIDQVVRVARTFSYGPSVRRMLRGQEKATFPRFLPAGPSIRKGSPAAPTISSSHLFARSLVSSPSANTDFIVAGRRFGRDVRKSIAATFLKPFDEAMIPLCPR